MAKHRTLYWSHLKAYEECPQKSLWSHGWGDIDLGNGPGKRKTKPKDKSMHHAVMGIVIQGVLEDFYNQYLWKHQDGLKRRLIDMTRDRLQSTLSNFYIDWNRSPGFHELEDTCVSGVLGYLKTMKQHRFLGQYAKSEVDLYGHSESWLPLGGRADFVIRRQDTGITLLDGKNSKAKMRYVDTDQLRWYALCFYLSYHSFPDRLGFVWFRYPHDPETGETGVDWIDFSKRDTQGLKDRAIQVRRGQEKEKFAANPSPSVCRFCDFESVCPERVAQKSANAAKRKPSSLPIFDENEGTKIFGFGEE